MMNESALQSHAPANGFNLGLRPRLVLRVTGWIVAGLVLAHVFRYVYFNYTSHPVAWGVVDRFDLNKEQASGAWFSTCMLLVCGGVAWLIAGASRQHLKRSSWRWTTIAGLLVLMSFDEAVSMHERFGGGASDRIETGGFLYFTWVLFAIPLLVAASVVLGPVLRQVPGRLRVLLIAAAAVYFGGAVGIEAVGGKVIELFGRDSLAYEAAVLAEETGEMLGLVLGLHGLLCTLQWMAVPNAIATAEASPQPQTSASAPTGGRVAPA